MTSESNPRYEPPAIAVRGTLVELTASHHMVTMAQVGNLATSFAASTVNVPTTPNSPSTPNGPVGQILPQTTTGGGPNATITNVVHPTVTQHTTGTNGHGVGGVTGSAPAAAGGAAGGAATSGGSGRQLPFTGFILSWVAGIGFMFTFAGATLRRFLRRRRTA